MQRFKRILVIGGEPDDTRDLLRLAGSLAEDNHGTVDLFDVVEPLSDSRRVVQTAGGPVDVQEVAAGRRLAELTALAEANPTPVADVGVAAGPPHVEIIKRVAAGGNDLLIIRSDELTARQGLGGATTTMHLLRKCHVPVWVVRETSPRPGVAVAVGPFVDGVPTELDVKLTQLAASMARLRGEHLHVVHAWRLEGESMLRSHRLAPSPAEVDALVDAALAEANAGVRWLLDEVGVEPAPSVHMVKGRGGEVLPDVLRSIKPGVLVMGTLARAGVRGLIIGNTAERMLSITDASVLAAKPEGFVSPVLG